MQIKKQIVLNKSGEVLLPIIWFGKEKEIIYDIYLAEKGASIKVLGVFFGTGESTVDVKVNIYHNSPETTSHFLLKGVLEDSSSINFDGLVKIIKGAKGSIAWLGAYLLLLSNASKGRAVPSLEIAENDIKAGHATTIGKVNELELFYLMSRGIPYEKSKMLLVEGFLSSVVNQLSKGKQSAVKERIAEYANNFI